jgi:ubiquinone/menaquinone biosynthesis C-methylase UbiE
MKDNHIHKYWNSPSFIQSYKTLDQDWHTKLDLYREALATANSMRPFNKHMSVLDLGGGLGTLRTVASHDYETYPIDMWTICDSSFEMMTNGRVFQSSETQPTSFIQADIQNYLPFESNSFDIVFCINFLYLFNDRIHTTHIAPEIARILRDNGLLIAVTPKPKANNSSVIIDEMLLRSKNNGFTAISILSVLKDIVTNLHFLSSQGSIITMANKKSPQDWAMLYAIATDNTLKPYLCTSTQSYGGQAGLWVLQKSVM